MTDWKFAQRDAAEQLCHLHYFSVIKRQPSGDVEFVITVREYVSPPDPTMVFLAQADKQTNQKTAPFTPTAWGKTISDALDHCIRAINRFPYEGDL